MAFVANACGGVVKVVGAVFARHGCSLILFIKFYLLNGLYGFQAA